MTREDYFCARKVELPGGVEGAGRAFGHGCAGGSGDMVRGVSPD